MVQQGDWDLHEVKPTAVPAIDEGVLGVGPKVWVAIVLPRSVWIAFTVFDGKVVYQAR